MAAERTGTASHPVPKQATGDPNPEERLDAEAEAVCHRLAGVLFPWDLTRSLELALLKTFCVPSIAALLDRSGEFARRPRKRYDDTGLMVAELLRHGPGSEAGRAVINRMNRIHGQYAIGNDDFLYVLSSFVAEPIHWLARYGWRPLNAAEQRALHRFWWRVGQQMAIDAIPESLEALLAFHQQFERQRFAAAPANRRVADATLAMLLRDWPVPLRPLIRRLLQALPEAAASRSLGWPEPPRWLQAAIQGALRLRSRLANGWMRLRPPHGSRFYSERPTPSYGAGFRLEQLGPPPLLERLNRPRWTGSQWRIGLTGGIATGKSSVAALLAAHGWPVLDADVFAREALAPGSPGERAVLERYGPRVVATGSAMDTAAAPVQGAPGGGGQAPGASEPSGAGTAEPDAGGVARSDAVPQAAAEQTFDRAALGRIVFADPAERRWLEALVHPLVRDRFGAELERLAAEPVVVLMIPLLFETGLDGLCSEVWLVDCEEPQQLQRLMARNALGEAEARNRIAAQWPLERKRSLADVVIDNRGDRQALEERVRQQIGAG